MPTMVCPNCKFRMLLAYDKCPNCGYDFSGVGGPSAIVPSTMGGQTTSPGSSKSSSRPLPVPAPTPPPRPVPAGSSPLPGPTASSPLPVPSGSSSLFGPLPAHMPPTPPDLEGTISSHPVTHRGVFTPTDWSLRLMRPKLSRGGRTDPRSETTITTIRVRRTDGTQREARLEGDLVGAGTGLGDEVSLWGRDSSGTLVVKRAYNHTTGAEIRIRPPYDLSMERLKASLMLGFGALCIISWIIS